MLDKQLTEMIFAIDYDGTYSERPQEISDFIECLLLNGDAAIKILLQTLGAIR